MKAIILATRRGHRFGSLTRDIPKCLLDFGDESILERCRRIFQEEGIAPENMIVVAGYQANRIQQLFSNVIVNDDYSNTELSYSLGLALEKINDDVIVVEGDVIFDQKVLHHLLHTPGNRFVVKEVEQWYEGDRVLFDETGKAVAIGKHLEEDAPLFKNMFRLDKAVIPIVKALTQNPKNRKIGYPVLLNSILSKVPFHALHTQNKIIQIKNVTEYLYAKNKFSIDEYGILLTNSTSRFKQKICSILEEDYPVIGKEDQWNEKIELNANDKLQCEESIKRYKPKVIVHIIDMEDEKTQRENLEVIRILCELSDALGVRLVYIHSEEIEYNDYIKRSEERVASRGTNLVVRVSEGYGCEDEFSHQFFSSKVIHALNQKKRIHADDLRKKTPVLVDEAAIVIRNNFMNAGVISINGSRAVTDYLWAKIIAEEFQLDGSLIDKNDSSGRQSSQISCSPSQTKLESTSSSMNYKVSNVEEGTRTLRKQKFCAFNLIYQSSPKDHLYGTNVGKFRYDLGFMMGERIREQLKEKVDCVIPVPNSGLFYAMGMAAAMEKPYVQALIKTDVSARSFQITDISQRENLIYTKIHPVKELLAEKNVLLVDEAIFTGTTLCVVCDMVRACGVKSIYIAIPTSISNNRCNQYVQPKRQLLSEFVGEGEAREYFKVDDLFFQDFNDFYRSITQIDHLCYECFDKIKGKENVKK